MRATFAFVLVVATARAAFAGGGIELDEQSAKGVGMAGAQVGIADDPAAIFYNPAGIALQPGFGALVGGNLVTTRTHISPDALTIWHTTAWPTAYVAQRFGRHIAVGIGSYSNMGEHFEYPPDWRGRFVGYEVDVLTATIQPTLAFRVFPWLSIGGGFSIVPASVELYRAINFGGGEGNVHVGFNAVGWGGNIGVLVEPWMRHLRLGFSYRTRVDLDLTGHGAISAPPELRAMTGGLQSARSSLILPHNFFVGAGFFWGHLQLDAEAHLTVWRDLQTLTVTLTDPSAPPGTPPTVDTIPLNLHNAWGARAGAQYGLLRHELLRVRIGAGYDASPLPLSNLGPLLPDTSRVFWSAGIGVHFGSYSIDLGYIGAYLIKKTSEDPNLIATYTTYGQIISLSLTVRWEHVLQHMPLPTYEEEQGD